MIVNQSMIVSWCADKWRLTFSYNFIHSDSKSTALESFKHFSKSLFKCTDNSEGLPDSNCGAAIGLSSTFILTNPSFGLDDFGCWISHDTWANTLWTANFVSIYIHSNRSLTFDPIGVICQGSFDIEIFTFRSYFEAAQTMKLLCSLLIIHQIFTMM